MSQILFKNWKNRLYLSILIWALHYYIIQRYIDFYISFLIIIIISLFLIFVTYKKDGLLIMKKREFAYGLFYFTYFIILIYLYVPPLINQFVLIFIKQATFEEIYFRFYMIGINKRYYNKILSIEFIMTLLASNLIFTIYHSENLYICIQVFLLGLIFSYIYFNTGIISSIITHAIWNFYLPTSLSRYFISPILILPFILDFIYHHVRARMLLILHSIINVARARARNRISSSIT